MTILGILLTLVVLGCVLAVSAVGIVFFSEWSLYVLTDFFKGTGLNHKSHAYR